MLRKIVEARAVVALAMAGGIGLWGLRVYPVSHDDVFLGLIGERAPGVLSVLTYGYATLWFTTPYFAASLVMSLVAIVVYRRAPRARVRPLPPYPQPEQRPTPSLVLGETALRDDSWTGGASRVVDHSATGPLHGRDGSGRRRHRQDVRVHVSVRRPAPSLARPTIRRASSVAWSWK